MVARIVYDLQPRQQFFTPRKSVKSTGSDGERLFSQKMAFLFSVSSATSALLPYPLVIPNQIDTI